MRRALPWVIAAGAVVVAIALGAMYVDAVTEPLVTEPRVTEPLPLLSEHANGVTLDPGKYVVDDYGAPSSATMAPVLQVPDGYFALDGSGIMASWYQVMWLFRIDSVYTHPCDPGGYLKDVGPSVADLANALAAQPMRDGTDPSPSRSAGTTGCTSSSPRPTTSRPAARASTIWVLVSTTSGVGRAAKTTPQA